jgi:anti-anti-sigma factor
MSQRHEDLQATSLNISISKAGNRTIISPKQSLDHQNCNELETALNSCGEQAGSDVILDFKAVKFMDSKALELLVRTHEALKIQGCMQKIIGVNPVCQDILHATRLVNILHVFTDLHEAIKSKP